MMFLKSIGLKVWGYILITAFILVFLWRVYAAGNNQAEVDSMKQTLDAVMRGKDVEKGVDSLSDSAVTEQLRKHNWVRN